MTGYLVTVSLPHLHRSAYNWDAFCVAESPRNRPRFPACVDAPGTRHHPGYPGAKLSPGVLRDNTGRAFFIILQGNVPPLPTLSRIIFSSILALVSLGTGGIFSPHKWQHLLIMSAWGVALCHHPSRKTGIRPRCTRETKQINLQLGYYFSSGQKFVVQTGQSSVIQSLC